MMLLVWIHCHPVLHDGSAATEMVLQCHDALPMLKQKLMGELVICVRVWMLKDFFYVYDTQIR